MSKNRIFRVIGFILFVAAVILVVCLEKADDIAYNPDKAASSAMESSKYVTVKEKNGYIAFEPAGGFYNKGIIFYPGEMVEAEAYAPLMHAIAEEGYLCVIVKMPMELAVLDGDKAEVVRNDYGNIADWYLAGHSQGGAMASAYAYENAGQIRGVILLAAYSAEDISDKKLDVLSVYGTEDKVLNIKKYEKYRNNLPADVTEIMIEGGNHTYFGNYGERSDDGVAQITAEEQQRLTKEAICQWLQQ